MSQIIKGSNLSVGNTVTIKIWNADHEATELFGQLTGIQEWMKDTLAVQLAGINSWIVLDSKTEVGLA